MKPRRAGGRKDPGIGGADSGHRHVMDLAAGSLVTDLLGQRGAA